MTIKKVVQDKLRALGFRIEAKAVKYAPSKTGWMRGKMFSYFDENTNVLTVGNTTKYAEAVEYGTPEMVAAHGKHDPENPVVKWAAKMKRKGAGLQRMPFLRPAIFEELNKFKTELKKPIKAKVRMVFR